MRSLAQKEHDVIELGDRVATEYHYQISWSIEDRRRLAKQVESDSINLAAMLRSLLNTAVWR